MFIIIK
jgi:hypothetical protein